VASGTETPRIRLAWLMWCYEQGYKVPEDRAIITNWLGDDDALLTSNDRRDRDALLGMADEVLDLMSGLRGVLTRTGHLNIDNEAGSRLLTLGREPDGSVILVARQALQAVGGNTVKLSAEKAAEIARYLTGDER
jgi:hypothetical protein